MNKSERGEGSKSRKGHKRQEKRNGDKENQWEVPKDQTETPKPHPPTSPLRERERGREGERGRAMIICDDERRNKKNQQVNTTKQHISATAELGKMENDTRHEKAAVQHITRRQ